MTTLVLLIWMFISFLFCLLDTGHPMRLTWNFYFITSMCLSVSCLMSQRVQAMSAMWCQVLFLRSHGVMVSRI